jgi:hypothetical protein
MGKREVIDSFVALVPTNALVRTGLKNFRAVDEPEVLAGKSELPE